MPERKWFKLDNAAKIYPAAQTRNWAAMFRLSIMLSEPVDPVLLEKAQEAALKRFPVFSCRLRNGLFWYYLERMDGAPPLHEDTYNPMQKLSAFENRGFLYRLLYYKERVAIEFFHAVTDGTGGTIFFLSLINEYLRLKYGVDFAPSKHIFSCSEDVQPEEYEDSFLKYATRSIIGRTEDFSYRIPAVRVPANRMMIISGTVSSDALREKAHEYQVTVTTFLSALLLYACHEQQQAESSRRQRAKYVKVSVPLNLRSFLPSRTLRNFSSYINVGVDGNLGLHSFEEVLDQVKHQLGMHLNARELQARISANVADERNPLIRVIPLFIKNPIMRLIYHSQGEKYFASQISNLGRISIPAGMDAYVSRFEFMLGRSASKLTNCAVASMNGMTVINFSRNIRESETERIFFSMLRKMGIHVFIDSNGSV